MVYGGDEVERNTFFRNIESEIRLGHPDIKICHDDGDILNADVVIFHNVADADVQQFQKLLERMKDGQVQICINSQFPMSSPELSFAGDLLNKNFSYGLCASLQD